MPLWLPVTFAAALFQTWRTAKQQKLRNLLSVNGAGFVRFLYGVPVGLVLLAAGLLVTGKPLPPVTPAFVAFCAIGGLLQIVATNLLIMAFGFRNFAVGTAYAKTEAAQSAVLAWLVLGEALKPLTIAGIAIGLAGVMALSLAGTGRQAHRAAVRRHATGGQMRGWPPGCCSPSRPSSSSSPTRLRRRARATRRPWSCARCSRFRSPTRCKR